MLTTNMENQPFWSGKDAVGRALTLMRRPERMISLVPSQTELLVDLGIGGRLVGRTRYCIHPHEAITGVPAIGGTKKIELEQIQALQPDFFLAEKEETPLEVVNALSALAPVYVTDVISISSAIEMCRTVGKLTGLTAQAASLADQIELEIGRASKITTAHERVLYLIWKKPWMAAGDGTFIHSCLEHIGFQNAAASLSEMTGQRYPELDPASIRSLNPDRIFLSSEPYPFKEIHAQELKAILPNAQIQLVDGELFSWYGSRMLKMPPYWHSLNL